MTHYQRLEIIGHGRQGVVYRAHDTFRNRTVALKTLHTLDAEGVYRLKREFRALADVAHPNLVDLYELVITDDERFFTMELVDGVDLVTWAEAHQRSPTHIAKAARQLVLAIGALHDAGKLHRDIKPSNVLVESGGRVVVLDFGLVAGTAPHDISRSPGGYLTGTLAYMAPEQTWGEPPSRHADWHMVGATLYEALTGRPPFAGAALRARIAGRQDAPPPPRTHEHGTPSALEEIVIALLAFEPAARPTFAEIIRQLDGDSPMRPPVPATVTRLIGRESELATLREAWEATTTNGLVQVHMHGASGIGKTALVEHFLNEHRAREHAIILRSRCHPQESIPFKAVDGIIDELSHVLADRGDDFVRMVAPHDVAALVRLFPVLGRLDVFATIAASETVEGEPHEIRRRALLALRTLLARLATQAPLVLWIDDLQWGDLDSIAVLRELQRTPDAPRCLLLLSFRAEDRTVSESLRALARTEDTHGQSGAATRELALGPLSVDAVRTLAREGLSATGVPSAATATLDVIASESGGSPFFVAELVRHFGSHEGAAAAPPPNVVHVLQQRIESLPPEQRRVLDLLAVAGRPIEETLAVAAFGIDDAWSELARLRHASLLRTITSSSGVAVTVYHDRIRDAALQLVPEVARAALHRQLATALEAQPGADPLLLVDHYLQADDRSQAARYAYASAERAEVALAFEQAARLYRRALDLHVDGHPPWEIEAKLADTLVNDSRGAEAAECYLSAARRLECEDPKRLDVIRLRRHAADQYLRSGYLDEGIRVLRTVLASVALPFPQSARRALLSLMVNRGRLTLARLLPRSTPRHVADAAERERLNVCWAAGLGISVFDSIRGTDFHVRHALLSLRTNDPSHRARSLATEAVIMAMEGGARRRRRADARLAEGEAIARTSDDARTEAHTLLMGAGVAFFAHRYRDVLARCEQGEALCRTRCTGVAWELANMQFLSAYSLAFLGELGRLQKQLPDMLRQARDRGDAFALTNFRVGMIALAWLAADAPDEARRQVTDALEGRTPHRSMWQHYMGTYALVQIDLYEGQPDVGLDRLRLLRSRLRSAHMLRFQSIRLEMTLLWTRCTLALAALANARAEQRVAARLIRQADRASRRIATEDARWAIPLADSLLGAGAAIRGTRAESARHLAKAADGFRRIDLQLHAAAAELYTTNLGGNSHRQQPENGHTNEPVTSTCRPEQWMLGQDIVDPYKLASVFIPGMCRPQGAHRTER